jgi:DNA primase large subunit
MIAIQRVTERKKGSLLGPSKHEPRRIAPESVEQSWKYMYRSPPNGEITIDEFETFARNRANLLHKIENWRAIGIMGDDLFMKINEEDRKEYGGVDALATSRKDWIAHNVLRLAYSRSEDLRRFFVAQESVLFENRLRSSLTELSEILKLNNLDVKEVSSSDRQQYQDELKLMLNQVQIYNSELRGQQVENAAIWKTHFTNALNLVGKRRTFIADGYAYLFKPQLLNVLSQHFRLTLAEKINGIHRHWPYLKEVESERIVPFLSVVTHYDPQYKDIEVKGGQVVPEQIDTLAQQSFPLCMKVLHRELRSKHHLRHQGRQQFGLFLKGIGLSLDDALRFWREEFTRNMTTDQFEKNYSYNIRHNYGKEGKRTNYTPYGCMKIITGLAPPTSEDHHGCPFKNFTPNNLRMEMKAFKREQVEEIIQLVEGKHYQVACRKYFEATHPPIKETNPELAKEDDGTAFNHPNSYYQKSRQLLDKR